MDYLKLLFKIIESPYQQAMTDVVDVCGPSFKAPTSKAHGCKIYCKVVQDVQEVLFSTLLPGHLQVHNYL